MFDVHINIEIDSFSSATSIFHLIILMLCALGLLCSLSMYNVQVLDSTYSNSFSYLIQCSVPNILRSLNGINWFEFGLESERITLIVRIFIIPSSHQTFLIRFPTDVLHSIFFANSNCAARIRHNGWPCIAENETKSDGRRGLCGDDSKNG